ncbi:carboxylate-amine ligase [soil metagenome]|jgi:carboxylate-amine ligase|nr:carboxylate-amine ligase [Deinococcota bacterium]
MTMQRPSLTIGIEEEYQIVNPETRELESFMSRVIDGSKQTLQRLDIKAELMQSTVETGTRVCRTVQEARAEVVAMRCKVDALARAEGLRVVAAGTHPFSNWQEQEITPGARYEAIVEDMQDLARQLLIFGMHVHIGTDDPEFTIDAMNILRYMTPHLLALSTSSPMWHGRDTGLKSYRSALFRRFPRTGVPVEFGSYAEFQNFVGVLVKTGCIEDGSKLWWDLRPHHEFPTLEFRICDLCTNLDDAICCAALFQALVFKHFVMRRKNTTFRSYPQAMVEENKWRALRYGVGGKLIDLGLQEELPARELIADLVAFVDDVVDELGSRQEVEHALTIVERGSSADKQLDIFRETGKPEAVVDWLISETMRGCGDGG